MRAYKFRSSAQIAFAFDIIINNRLHCSNWQNLNDPMEGMFAFSHGIKTPKSIVVDKLNGIDGSKKRLKICSLSATFDSHLLWAHYAGGFDGVAIEVELPDNDPNIKRVEPRGVFAFLDLDKIKTEEEAARTILFSKYQEWAYEKEVRILNESEWYLLNSPIKRVIAGHRMSEALFSVLNITCSNLGIILNRVGIGDEGIDADYVQPFKSFKI